MAEVILAVQIMIVTNMKQLAIQFFRYVQNDYVTMLITRDSKQLSWKIIIENSNSHYHAACPFTESFEIQSLLI